MKAHGITVRPEWIVRGGFMEADGYRAMQKLLAARPAVDAVFASNDPSAIGAMKAIWDARRRVPRRRRRRRGGRHRAMATCSACRCPPSAGRGTSWAGARPT